MNTPSKERRVSNATGVAELLRQRRKTLKRTQHELASKLGISQARFSTLESNTDELTLDRLIALTTLLDLEVVIRERSAKKSRAAW